MRLITKIKSIKIWYWLNFDTINYCVRYDFDSVAMWPLLQVLDILLLGATARLQQCDQLVLAISREIEPVHIRKREQSWILSWVSGLQCCRLPTDSYCTMVQNINCQPREPISLAVAVLLYM